MGLVTRLEQRPGSEASLAGVRGAVTAVAKEHAGAYPEQMREYMAPKLKAFCDMIADEALSGDRTAKIIFAKTMGDIGAKDALVQALVAAVGARSVDHLKSAASVAIDAEEVDEEAAVAEALEMVQQYRRERGLPELIEAPVDTLGEVPGA
jgi:hypothetical protein